MGTLGTVSLFPFAAVGPRFAGPEYNAASAIKVSSDPDGPMGDSVAF